MEHENKLYELQIKYVYHELKVQKSKYLLLSECELVELL